MSTVKRNVKQKVTTVGTKENERRKRARKIGRVLEKLFPDASIALRFGSPWELYVAVVLSAQCTDKKVNEVTARLFKKYSRFEDYTGADPLIFAHDVRQTGFYRTKAKHILAAAKLLDKEFDGRLPCTMEELLRLPGVARKTANVILGNVCDVVVGIAVDTHVKRFAQKFNLSDSKDPVKIEHDLMVLFPKKEWPIITYRLIEYGRHICPARPHDCIEHPLTRVYPPAAKIWPRAK